MCLLGALVRLFVSQIACLLCALRLSMDQLRWVDIWAGGQAGGRGREAAPAVAQGHANLLGQLNQGGFKLKVRPRLRSRRQWVIAWLWEPLAKPTTATPSVRARVA